MTYWYTKQLGWSLRALCEWEGGQLIWKGCLMSGSDDQIMWHVGAGVGKGILQRPNTKGVSLGDRMFPDCNSGHMIYTCEKISQKYLQRKKCI